MLTVRGISVLTITGFGVLAWEWSIGETRHQLIWEPGGYRLLFCTKPEGAERWMSVKLESDEWLVSPPNRAIAQRVMEKFLIAALRVITFLAPRRGAVTTGRSRCETVPRVPDARPPPESASPPHSC